MNETKNGGPAFPLVAQNWHREGMTLRDYFAAKAMQSLLIGGYEDLTTDYWDSIPNDAYVMADAMLKAREK